MYFFVLLWVSVNTPFHESHLVLELSIYLCRQLINFAKNGPRAGSAKVLALIWIRTLLHSDGFPESIFFFKKIAANKMH